MNTNSLAFFLFLGTALPLTAVASRPQDMQRINDLVSQAQGLADSARAAATAPIPADNLSAQFYNPFSENRAPLPKPLSSPKPFPPATAGDSTVVAGQTNSPNVQVDDQQIQVNAGGRQFVIPRVPNYSRPHGIAAAVPHPPHAARETVNRAMAMATNYRSLADAIRAFRNADYAEATRLVEQTSQELPQPIFDPFYSLCLFAKGDLRKSSAAAYSAAARSQVWSWDTLQGYYGNPDLYKQQYARLQTAAQDPAAEASLHFLLGYHHLMLGHRDFAAQEFDKVLVQLNDDPVVLKLLQFAQQAPPRPRQ